ncbi:hypothetical protein FA15DRAFT_339767 [Coprinopsis marcescibilis]|uniref:C2H2-type domain-containing protein n=1 Tax=Coprinopsis marcescibilis TaxID=230819 RepID=A0A5C3KZG6_COPMA|nr:hypothetical protein FA15DRAFT_339767 [Coprinopsis marcescibilis]
MLAPSAIMALASSERLLEAAKDIIRAPPGFTCEWHSSTKGKPCNVVLWSWNVLQKHLVLHVHACRSNQGWIECKLPRCNQRNHHSQAELLQHIDDTHLSRLLLPCPIAACNFNRLWKPSELVRNVLDHHPEMFQDGSPTVPLTATLRPFTPTTISALPLLPKGQTTGLAPVRRGKRLEMGRSQQQGSQPFKRRARQLRPQEKAQDDSDSEGEGEDFEPLRSFKKLVDEGISEEAILEQNMVVAIPDKGLDMRLSGPPPLLDAELYAYKDPPPSILFEAFARKVMALAPSETHSSPLHVKSVST